LHPTIGAAIYDPSGCNKAVNAAVEQEPVINACPVYVVVGNDTVGSVYVTPGAAATGTKGATVIIGAIITGDLEVVVVVVVVDDTVPDLMVVNKTSLVPLFVALLVFVPEDLLVPVFDFVSVFCVPVEAAPLVVETKVETVPDVELDSVLVVVLGRITVFLSNVSSKLMTAVTFISYRSCSRRCR
jgi:hypothetical protein